MGGSFERLTASGKPTHYFGARKSRSALAGCIIFCSPCALRTMERGFASSWLCSGALSKPEGGSPVRILVRAAHNIPPPQRPRVSKLGSMDPNVRWDGRDERKRRRKKTALSPRSGVPSRAQRAGDKHKALSPRSGVPSRAQRTGDKHKALSRRAA